MIKEKELSEEISRLKEKIEELLEIKKSEKETKKEIKIVMEEKETLLTTITQLKENLMMKNESYDESYKKCKETLEKNEELMCREKELNEEITLLKEKIEELLEIKKSEEETKKEIKVVMKEKETLITTITQLKENLMMKNESYDESYKKCKETLEKNEELMVKEKELSEEISMLKVKMEELIKIDIESTKNLRIITQDKDKLMEYKDKLNNEMLEIKKIEKETMKKLKEALEVNDKLTKSKEEESTDMNLELEEKKNMLVKQNEEMIKAMIKLKEDVGFKDQKYNETCDKVNVLQEEKKEFSCIIEQMKEGILMKDNELESKDIIYKNLLEENKSITNKLEERISLSNVQVKRLEDDLSLRKSQLETLYEELSHVMKDKGDQDIKLMKLDDERNECQEKLTLVIGENKKLLNEIMKCKEEIISLKKDKDDIKHTLTLTMTEKGELYRLAEDFKTTIVLGEESCRNKDDVIQKLEKNNLLLKAKSLKMKKQYDEKLVSLSQEVVGIPRHLAQEQTTDSPLVCRGTMEDTRKTSKSVSLDTSDLVDSTLRSVYSYNEVSPDEMSFVNKLQSFSDEVDSRARQVNMEIERFLERNEEVTINLSPDITAQRKSLCDNPHCQRISSKNRDLLVSIDRLREQNQLMKNKIIDMKSSLEYEKEIHQQINKEAIMKHEELAEILSKLSEERNEFKEQLTSSQYGVKECEEEGVEKERIIVKLNKELIEWKGKFDKGNMELKEQKRKVIELKERLKECQESFDLLTVANDCKSDQIKTLNGKISDILVKYGPSFQDNVSEGLYVDILEDNIIKLEYMIRKIHIDSENLQEELKGSIRLFIETMKSDFSKASSKGFKKVDDRYRLMLKNNDLLEESLASIQRRMDKIVEKCDLENCSSMKDKWDLTVITEEDESENPEISHEMMEYGQMSTNQIFIEEENMAEFESNSGEVEGEAEYLNEERSEIENGKEILGSSRKEMTVNNNNITSSCGNCLKLEGKIEGFKLTLVRLLTDVVPVLNKKKEYGRENDLVYYCDLIEEVIIGRQKSDKSINAYTQTFTEALHYRKIEDLLKVIMDEVVGTERIVEEYGLEMWFDGINEMRSQMTKLRNDLKLEIEEKSELSDRFERLFIELEKSCDSEVEELKSTINFLNNKIVSLQEEKETQQSTLRDYKVQLSYLQSVVDKPEDLLLKDENQPLARLENSEVWLSNLNDALKETISEKEDHITELIDRINGSSNRSKQFVTRNEELELEVKELQWKIECLSDDSMKKDKLLQENNDVINELEAVCVEKENRINTLEKESAEVNVQLEQYISAICSMEARLEESKPNLEFILTKIENKDNNMQLLNLIDQLEKDYAEELEQSEVHKSKIEGKLNKAIVIIHKLKRQLKESHNKEIRLGEELRTVKLECHCKKVSASLTHNQCLKDVDVTGFTALQDASVQIEDEELKLLRGENTNFKGIIENLHVNNFLLWKELDNVKKTDRNVRGSSLPLMNSSNISGNSGVTDSERSTSPVSQLSWNSVEGNVANTSQLKDLQRKLQRVQQQLNQMRIERNRIHQEYSRIRQLKEVADNKVVELMRKIDSAELQEDVLSEKDELIKTNNHYATQIVELKSEIEMTKVRNSILETKCKKIELKLTSQRRKYDQLVLRLDEKEQEIDRGSDEIRRNISNFEKEKVNWLREKKEMKFSLNSKDEKVNNLRKRLSNKGNAGENSDSEYLLEISQLEGSLNDQMMENKRITTQNREQMTKCHGQIEELIDENRQLKRKLSLGYSENNIKTKEVKKNETFIMDAIEEESGSVKNTEKKTLLANVVMEKEKLLTEISMLRNSLENEKDKSLHLEKEIKKIINGQLTEDQGKVATRNLVEFHGSTKDGYTMTERSEEAVSSTCSSSTQTKYSNEYKEQFCQSEGDFEMFYAQKLRREQLASNVDKYLQVNIKDSEKECELRKGELIQDKVDVFTQTFVGSCSFMKDEYTMTERSEGIALSMSTLSTQTIQSKEFKEQFCQSEGNLENNEYKEQFCQSEGDFEMFYAQKLRREQLASNVDKYLQVSIEDSEKKSELMNCKLIQDRVNVFVQTMFGSYGSMRDGYTMTEKREESVLSMSTLGTQTIQSKEFKEQFCQSDGDFEMFYVQELRRIQLARNVDKSLQINFKKVNFKTSETQTLESKDIASVQKSVEHVSCSKIVQTEEDHVITNLKEDINKKNNAIEQYCRQVSKKDTEVRKLKCDLNKMSNNLSILENQNLEYQEAIGLLELDHIDKERKYKDTVGRLNYQVEQLVRQTESCSVDVVDKADQTYLHQPANEGWDMEWDYEKLTVENHKEEFDSKIYDSEKVENVEIISDLCGSKSFHQEITPLERLIIPNNIQNDLIEILKDEISEVKNVINEKNVEIGQLKCIRNKLENELLESGQQIKDSNMEFLNLKENVQVLQTERDMVRDKIEDIEGQFNEMINFIEMITYDLRRLGDTNNESKNVRIINEHADDSRVRRVVKELEDELHKLLQQLQSKDSKLQDSVFKIEQLTCAIHKAQLQQTKPYVSVDNINVQQTEDKGSMTSTCTVNDESIISINELSQLLEQKHLEIEGLKSRLFLATDQLIHFRTFFANPENMLQKELLLVTRHHVLGLNEDDRSAQNSSKDHTKVVIGYDDQSDSDQSLISNDGNTLIRVERAHCPSYRRSYGFWFLNYILGSARYKKLVHSFKGIFVGDRRNMVFLRSQPRINLKAILTIYLVVIHLLIIWCLFL